MTLAYWLAGSLVICAAWVGIEWWLDRRRTRITRLTIDSEASDPDVVILAKRRAERKRQRDHDDWSGPRCLVA